MKDLLDKHLQKYILEEIKVSYTTEFEAAGDMSYETQAYPRNSTEIHGLISSDKFTKYYSITSAWLRWFPDIGGYY